MKSLFYKVILPFSLTTIFLFQSLKNVRFDIFLNYLESLNLIKIVENLRDKKEGCLWCNSQTSETIAKYSLEEAKEVFEAIKKGNNSIKCFFFLHVN